MHSSSGAAFMAAGMTTARHSAHGAVAAEWAPAPASLLPAAAQVASGLERVGAAPRMDETPAGRVVPARPATLTPPGDRETMLQQAAGAVQRAQADGITRGILRLFLPRDGELSPPDESWTGGIMELYRAASPLTRELLRRLSSSIAGVPPALNEQRLDASGVDSESVWMAQSSKPENDAVGFVQPSQEIFDQVASLTRQAGILGALGGMLGGKRPLLEQLEQLSFLDLYNP